MLKRFVALFTGAVAIVACSTHGAADIAGAGATFPAPIYTQWAHAYNDKTGLAVNYQAIGSGGGIKQIEASTVDFGASDKPLKPAVLAAKGLIQFPTVIGGIVPVVNIPGVTSGQLRLTGKVLADIYRGVYRYWDDPTIKSYNPRLNLPHRPITVVHRSDGSGSTFLFTSYLALEAPHWASEVGASDSVKWPVGIGGKSNDGVAAVVKQTPGSIGYVEYAYARPNHMTFALMQSRMGVWVAPQAANFIAAARWAKWENAPGFYLLLLDQPGTNSWPITGATFILVHTLQTNPRTGHWVLAFFDWAYKNGDAAAEALDYVPLPANVKALIRGSWTKVVGPDGNPVYP